MASNADQEEIQANANQSAAGADPDGDALGPMAKYMRSPKRIQRGLALEADRMYWEEKLRDTRRQASLTAFAAASASKRQRILENVPETDERKMELDAMKQELVDLRSKEPEAPEEAEEDELDEDDEGEDPWAKYRPDIMKLLTKSPGLGWDAVVGQPEAISQMERTVDAINGNYESRPNAALLFVGPTGVGKTTAAMVMASQMDCTFFNVPKGFAKGKPEMWAALFAIAEAEEYAPSVISIDECDGSLSSSHVAQVPALKQVWEPTDKTRPYVLVIGATNYPEKLDKSLQSRFAKRIHFAPCGREIHRVIIGRNVTIPLGLEDAEWDTLLDLVKDFADGRQLQSVCNDVSVKVEHDVKKGRRNDLTVRLADFQQHMVERSQASNETDEMLAENMGDFVRNWVSKVFRKPAAAAAAAGTTTAAQRRKVVSLQYMLESLLSDEQVQSLKATLPRKEIPPRALRHQTRMIENLLKCLQKVFPDCEQGDNQKGFEFTFLSRQATYFQPSHGQAGKFDKYVTQSNVSRQKGIYFTNLEFKPWP